MAGRALTRSEVSLARSVFGDAIAYDKVRVFNRKWWPLQPAKTAMAPDGNLWFAPAGELFCEDFCERPIVRQALFMHEMTHVWQHQQGVFLPLARHPFCKYKYEFVPGKPFAKYGIEQQAEIVRHVFMAQQGKPVPGKPPLAELAAVLPFGNKAAS